MRRKSGPAHRRLCSDTGIIRLEFPDAPNSGDENLQKISWDDFFEKFDDQGFALVY